MAAVMLKGLAEYLVNYFPLLPKPPKTKDFLDHYVADTPNRRESLF